MDIGPQIVEEATKYIGVQEISGNLGFKDEEFEHKMELVGWEKGQAWCVYFCELVWKEIMKSFSMEYRLIDKLFSGSAVITYENFRKSDNFDVGVDPMPGSIAIWQTYRETQEGLKPYWTGHAAIVRPDSDITLLHTIDGNTNSRGGREGIEVAPMSRSIDFENKVRGLNIKGFIFPII